MLKCLLRVKFNRVYNKLIMKTIKRHLKALAIILSILVLAQSCRVYSSTPITVDKAVSASKVVKIKEGKSKYNFKYLKKIEGKVYGYAPRNFDTAKKLSDQIVGINKDDGYIKIELSEAQTKEIYPVHKGLSVIVTVASILVPLMLIMVIAGKESNYYGPNIRIPQLY